MAEAVADATTVTLTHQRNHHCVIRGGDLGSLCRRDAGIQESTIGSRRPAWCGPPGGMYVDGAARAVGMSGASGCIAWVARDAAHRRVHVGIQRGTFVDHLSRAGAVRP